MYGYSQEFIGYLTSARIHGLTVQMFSLEQFTTLLGKFGPMANYSPARPDSYSFFTTTNHTRPWT
jgi:hypothetical protein